MANSFKRKTSRNIGTSLVTVGSYTVGSNTETTIIGLTCANVTTSAVTADVVHVDSSANNTHLVKTATVPAGGSLVVVGGEITTKSELDVQQIVRGVLREIGYTDASYGIDADSCAVLN